MADFILDIDNTLVEHDADADRDHWFNAIEAKEYGLVDDVIYKKK